MLTVLARYIPEIHNIAVKETAEILLLPFVFRGIDSEAEAWNIRGDDGLPLRPFEIESLNESGFSCPTYP